MAGSFWRSAEYLRYRAQEEIAKAVDVTLLPLRIQHLEEAQRLIAEARRLDG